jgi:hypothetical protein
MRGPVVSQLKPVVKVPRSYYTRIAAQEQESQIADDGSNSVVTPERVGIYNDGLNDLEPLTSLKSS